MSEWKAKKLGDLIHIKHGYGFKSRYFTNNGSHILLTPGNFYDAGGFKYTSKTKYYVGPIPDNFIHKRDDLIVAMTEQAEGLLGSTALVPEGNKYLHNQRLGLISILDEKELDKGFLYRLFNTPLIRLQIRASANGTKVRHTSPSRIYLVKINLPPLDVQKKITAVLSAYDDLIENNNKRIGLLERAAEEIYREWFVRMRFPGWETAVFDKGIPVGWEVERVDSLGKIITGKTPSKKNSKFHDGQIQFIKTPDMHGNLFIHKTNDTLTLDGMMSQPSQTIPAKSICVSCIGTGGVVSVTTSECQTNQQINSIILSDQRNLEWAFFVIKNLKETIKLFGGTGTTMTNLSKGKFSALKIIVPTSQFRELYHDVAENLFSQIEILVLSNANLKQSRDLLLSRLISGKLPVDTLDIATTGSLSPAQPKE